MNMNMNITWLKPTHSTNEPGNKRHKRQRSLSLADVLSSCALPPVSLALKKPERRERSRNKKWFRGGLCYQNRCIVSVQMRCAISLSRAAGESQHQPALAGTDATFSSAVTEAESCKTLKAHLQAIITQAICIIPALNYVFSATLAVIIYHFFLQGFLPL